ncbi:G-type lectin S-receptor-like serine/threonine-protein kinase At4g27290 isoform X2 [Durio zibethinus]|uniref:Receptor-like serine/threonine-protein kinase n=1 Tax=Durio zibethinus TaxID=66656 RepID=A0A6P5WQ85_DURZI|nr:G-type lectin S-receptor-like serine/threonine-protein kinase At4g27290 isoform X2 [Durio zibethinus]
MENLSFILIKTLLLIFCARFSGGIDSFTYSQSVSDGRTLVSRDGNFELGLFNPRGSRNSYLGIWYKKITEKTVVWVANRCNPINDTYAMLLLNRKGNLILLSRSNGVVWSANSTKVARNPIVQLLDSGNLVVRDGSDDENSETFLWQSFDYPTDTIMPAIKYGWDLRTGLNRRLSAWKNSDDPSPGDYTTGIELNNYPDLVSWRGTKKNRRAGPWNGLGFSGAPLLRPSPGFHFEFVWNNEEVYFRFYVSEQSGIIRYVLNQTNYQTQGYFWSEESRTWVLSTYPPIDVCDNYGLCGAYGSCDSAQVVPCQCLKGFKSNASQYWDSINWSRGCVRHKPLYCKGDVFIKFGGLKLPDTTHSWVDKSIGLKECRAICLQNCSCMAYANTDIRGKGSGCAIWFGDLIDMKQFAGGQDLYIRMSSSEAEPTDETQMKIAVSVITSTVIFIVGLLLVCYYICRSHRSTQENHGVNTRSNEGQKEDIELHLFDLATIVNATKDFTSYNKLGEGGFGPVYKGTLEDGQEIAVKRLSKRSRQGSKEFKNEVALVAKLQHRNLVKLLGCCIQGEERILVYEFMPNRSLNSFIFDSTRHKLLNWPKRFHIINGVARGLVYLHQDSRLRIIHRDLKTSNVLLDSEMNPKISDFGLAKTFGGDQAEGSTNRVVGTYGYMAPEYAMDGQFSVKSDVFSFGILVLEIISGKKNTGFYHPIHDLNLIGQAWRLWKIGKPLELIDSFLQESCSPSEVVRCIHIALLCVQQRPEDRPSMSSVVLMLGGETALVKPKEPGFLINKKLETECSSTKIVPSSTNDVSISIVEGR